MSTLKATIQKDMLASLKAGNAGYTVTSSVTISKVTQ
jgi:hypothetical protein